MLNPLKIFFVMMFLWVGFGCHPKRKPSENKKESGVELWKSEKNLQGIRVGYCSPTMSAPFFVALADAVKRTTEAYGMEFISVDGQGDIAKQVAAMEDLIAKQVNILILNPLDPQALIPSVNAAKKMGIPVFIVDSYIEPEAEYVSSVVANNQLNGELVGEWLASQFNTQQINAAIISGTQGNPVGREKRLGVLRGISDNQLRSKGKVDFKIVAQGWGSWSNNGGLKAMEDILVAHPEVNVLIAENDDMAMGALRAIDEAGKKILIVAFDGQKEALEQIKNKKFGATALNSPKELGRLVVETVAQHLNGINNQNRVVYTKSLLITTERVKEYYDPTSIF